VKDATMNVLLVWPEIPITYWGGQFAIRLIGKKTLMPPLGLLTVAAMCPSDWNMKLVDLNHEILTDEDLVWADTLLLSGMAIQHASMMETIARARAHNVTTVVGGPHVTSSPEKFDDANYLVVDEGEITFTAFLKDFVEGKAERFYTANGEKPDVTITPVPRFDLLKMDAYTHMCIQFSRGCPFACEFCDITTLFGKKPRTKTPEQILAELKVLYDLEFRGEVFLVDDNFIGNKKNVRLLLPHLIEWMKEHEYPFWLYTEASLNIADDDELLELMCEAGFHSVFIGIETPSLESLRETQKYQNLQGDMLSKVHKVQSFGLEVMAGFIVGFDSDTEDIFDRQIEFITQSRIAFAMVGPLNAMPNTQLWDRLKREGRLLRDFDGDNLAISNFVTVLPALSLVRGYRHLLASLYNPTNFFERLYDMISSLKSKNRTLGRLSLRTKLKFLFPLVGALVRLGVTDRDRKEYWRFMMRVLKNHPDKWLFSLCRAIMGYHFIRYTEETMVPRLNLIEREMMAEEAVTAAAPVKIAV
jgi:radical SAM superfamily enzyme YgiQ (UPF0313 family)